MPTYTAITLDRLMEPGVTIPKAAMKNGDDSKLNRWRSTNSMADRRISHPGSMLERGVSIPKPKSNGNNSTLTSTSDRKHHSIRSPALYATPESTPLPDSPSSFPPSPYIVNHKRRGPRLLKTFSEVDVAVHDQRSQGQGIACSKCCYMKSVTFSSQGDEADEMSSEVFDTVGYCNSVNIVFS